MPMGRSHGPASMSTAPASAPATCAACPTVRSAARRLRYPSAQYRHKAAAHRISARRWNGVSDLVGGLQLRIELGLVGTPRLLVRLGTLAVEDEAESAARAC